MIDLANALVEKHGGKVISVKLQDHNYDYAIYRHSGGWWSHRLWRWFKKVSRPFAGTNVEVCLSHFYGAFGGSFDQTWMGGDRLAQIQFIVRK